MNRVHRTTFIHPDGRTKRVHGGRVRRRPNSVAVWVRRGREPEWAAVGVHIVAAHDDGSVETAFVASRTGQHATTGAPGPQFISYHE